MGVRPFLGYWPVVDQISLLLSLLLKMLVSGEEKTQILKFLCCKVLLDKRHNPQNLAQNLKDSTDKTLLNIRHNVGSVITGKQNRLDTCQTQRKMV